MINPTRTFSSVHVAVFLHALDDAHHLAVCFFILHGLLCILPHGILRDAYDIFHFAFNLAFALVFLYDAHCLFHFALVVEVHFDMNAITTDIIKQWFQLVKSNPTSHNALSTSEYLLVKVIPFRTTALRLTHTRRPLNSVQFFNLQQGRKMVHGSHTVKMIECIVNLLTLLADERLNKAVIIVYTDHR